MDKIRFNDHWKVWREEDPFEMVFSVPDNAVTVDLPYDVMFHEEQKGTAANGGSTGYLDGSVYRYYKEFYVGEEDLNRRMILEFEGIYRNAVIYINQSEAGNCAYGYTDFTLDITDFIRYGKVNTILVIVKCGTKNSRWYSGAGIFRDVFLYKGGNVRIDPASLHFTTAELSEDGALVRIDARLQNDSPSAREISVGVVIADDDGKEKVCESYPVRIRSGSSLSFSRNLYLEQPKLWDDHSPHLTCVTVTLREKDVVLDQCEITTGIRKLSLDAKHGLRVNGRTVKLRGACLHHDQGLLGAATYDDYELWRVSKLKEAGFNAVRSAHNPASRALLAACDKLGMYVMDEFSDVWEKSKTSYDYAADFDRCYESDLRSMVKKDYNHPCVVLYSTGNEISEIATDKGVEMSRTLGQLFHSLDPTRYTTNGINGAFAAGDDLKQIVDDITNGQADTKSGDINVFMQAMEEDMPDIVTHPVLDRILEKLDSTMDVLGYNYMTARYLKDAKRYPDRLMVGSETYPKQIAENWDAVTKCSAVIGDFTWTGFDYLGEISGPFPGLINQAGDLSVTGNRRPVSYYREIVFGLTKKPCIAVQDPSRYGTPRAFGPWRYTDCTFNYTYKGQEGAPILIQVYSGGDFVELFQNGKSLGKKPCGKETRFEAQFDALYVPGCLTAVAYENGKETGKTTLCSSEQASGIRLSATRYETLAFVDAELSDRNGNPVTGGSVSLQIAIDGEADLLGFGSEQAVHDHGFENPETQSFDGHALAILKLHQNAKEITVTVSGPDLDAAAITL